MKALSRQVHRDFDLGRFPVRKGESINLFFPGVNLDPAEWGSPLSIEMILSQAFYEPKTGGMTIGGGTGTSEDTTALFVSLFGGGDRDGADGGRRSLGSRKLTAWQRFRKRFLPF